MTHTVFDKVAPPAGQFGASITPVREALRQLEAGGLVVAEPHRGVRVAGVDLDQVRRSLMLDSAERAQASHPEHLTILEGLDNGDPDRVAAATELHLRNGFAAILRHLTGSEGPDPFDLDVD
jgi:DNA-binding GntR family transcriptional regulator